MKEGINTYWIVIILVTIIAILITFQSLPISTRFYIYRTSVTKYQQITINNKVEIQVTHPYLEIAKEIASTHTYDYKLYNCWDYATDLKKALVKAGYKTKIALGAVDCSSGLFDTIICEQNNAHNWIILYLDKEVWIEATTGEVIPPENLRFYHYAQEGIEKVNGYKKWV